MRPPLTTLSQVVYACREDGEELAAQPRVEAIERDA
jgi:hypothetical protein